MNSLSLALGCILSTPCLPTALLYTIVLLVCLFCVCAFCWAFCWEYRGEVQLNGQGKAGAGSAETASKPEKEVCGVNKMCSSNLDGVGRLGKCPIANKQLHKTSRKQSPAI